jgi:hypothetical protein
MLDSRFIGTHDLLECPNSHAEGNTVDPSARLSSRHYTFVGLSSRMSSLTFRRFSPLQTDLEQVASFVNSLTVFIRPAGLKFHGFVANVTDRVCMDGWPPATDE